MRIRIIKYLFVCLLAGVFQQSYAQLKTGLSLGYLERAPASSSPHPPLIILLHGVGSNEADLFSFANKLPGNARIISARAPYVQGGDRYAWFHIERVGDKFSYREKEAEKSRKLLLTFIDELKKKYDTDHVILLGFSQGAIMSFSVALSEPEKLKGIAALSGRVLPETKTNAVARNRLKHTRVFIGHGTRDSVLPVTDSRAANTLCKDLGMHVMYKEYDMAHEISQQEMSDLLSWLRATLAGR